MTNARIKWGAAAAVTLLVVAGGAWSAQTPGSALNLNVRYGVLVKLTGPSGAQDQLWNQATVVAVDYVNKTLAQMGLATHIKAELVDAQDSQGAAASGVEGAQKLVAIDHVSVVMGDILSAVTAAVASSVTIPNHIVEFTGGTAPALPELNPKSGPPLLYQPPASNNLEGVVLAQVIGDALGRTAAVNVAADNNLGNGLAANFKTAWTAAGGTIPEYVLYNETQPTLDTAAEQLVQGSPAGWLFIDFCTNLPKLADPLQRTGRWNPDKTFGSGTLADCKSQGQMTIPGMRAVRADVSAGKALPQYQAYYERTATGAARSRGGRPRPSTA